jgi:hypothetical protein
VKFHTLFAQLTSTFPPIVDTVENTAGVNADVDHQLRVCPTLEKEVGVGFGKEKGVS